MLGFTHKIGDKAVNSDSVNLGSNPSSPATVKAHETGTSGDFGPAERGAKSEQSGYGGCTEPGTAATLGIPTEPKAFQRWLTKQGCWTSWPSDLVGKAIRAGHALTAPGTHFWRDYEFRKRAKADWNAFLTAYAAYRAEVA